MPVAADPADPLQLRLDYQVMRDSNFFRQPATVAPSSEVIQILSAGLIVDKSLSRQTLQASLTARQYRYQNHRTLDFDGIDFKGDWRWRIGNDWSGLISISENDTAGGYEDSQTQNLLPYRIRQRTRSANAGYQLGPVTSLRAAIADYERESTLSTTDRVENRSGEFGIRFDSPAGSYLGLNYRRSKVAYPDQQSVGGTAVDNGYEDREVRATTHWAYSGKTTLDAWVSLFRRRHNQYAERDVSGLQGRLSANWGATGQILFAGEIWRTLSPIEQLTASYTLNSGAALAATWNISAKLALRGKVSREERDYRGDPGYVLNTGPRRLDTLFTPEIALDYRPWRQGGLSLSYQAPERTSNYPLAGYEYNALTLSAFAAF